MKEQMKCELCDKEEVFMRNMNIVKKLCSNCFWEIFLCIEEQGLYSDRLEK